MKDYKKLLHNLMLVVERENASDLHLSPNRKPVMRVDGELIHLETYDILKKEDTFGMLKAIVDEEKLTKVMNSEEIDFAYAYEGHLRLRSTAYVQSSGINLTFRVIQAVRELDTLNLPPILEEFTKKEQGLFLVVGPVGQGKSTTMAAMLQMINHERKEHIVTIENPIEYIFKDDMSIIDQREVGIDTKSFETGLKALFRQDMNVIMVGEMRTPETISTVVTAAETGHLVFSTLHTNSAAQTIDRIIDSFPSTQQNQVRSQLASSLLGIFSQRLIPSMKGGLVPAYELMINNKAVANLIREERVYEINTVIETGSEHGMIDMNKSLIRLIQSGDISIETAYKHSLNPRLLESMI
ncbi:MAG: PilT/PilU family type 4a pilus ATPase [Candidatus Pacebacteria bacterium]|nr:PilT/PilU family type 4a pilus ATPase [Candidatus Paceibacterota bacterium]